MKILILLLALKGLIPSRQTRKKWKKRYNRIRRVRKLEALRSGTPIRKPAKKKFGLLRKIRLVFRLVTFVCIAVPAVSIGRKGYLLAQKYRKTEA